MRYLLTTLLTLSACTGGTDLCKKVTCPSDRKCEEATGRCLGVDAGPVDAGETDAGTQTPDSGAVCPVPCAAPRVCDFAGGRCVDCLTDAQCQCPNPVCNAGFCVQRPADDGGIKQAPVPAESCATATPFTFLGCTTPRTYRFRVNLTGNDDEQGVCSAAMGLGRDFVYVLRLEATYDLRVEVAPVPGSPAEPVVYVRRMPCGGQELACSPTGPANLLLRSRTPGDYAIVVDTRDITGGGEVEVAITLSAPTQPPNDTCLSAEPIPTDGGVVHADLSLATNDEATTCNMFGVDSRDVAWTFNLPTTADIVARAERADGGNGVSPFFELRQGTCGPGTAKACARPNAEGQSSLRLRSAAAGTWYLVVEAFDGGASGPIDVSVAVQPPSPPLQHDTCAAPQPIAFTDGGTFLEFDIDTTTAEDDERGSCSATGSPEYIYVLHLLDPKRVAITAAPGPASPADPVLFVRQNSCTTGTQMACNDDQTDGGVTAFVSSGMATWPPGDYFIFVESYGTDVGPTHVTVFAAP